MDRTKLLSLNDRKIQSVEVPQWDDTVFIRSWSVSERQTFLAKVESCTKSNQGDVLLAWSIVNSLCDESGALLLEQSDCAALLDKNVAALDTIAKAITELNGITAKKVEEAKKE